MRGRGHRGLRPSALPPLSPSSPEVWYTDAYGRNGRTEAFPNSIRQWIAVGESEAGADDGGPVIGDEREYSGAGTRAPN